MMKPFNYCVLFFLTHFLFTKDTTPDLIFMGKVSNGVEVSKDIGSYTVMITKDSNYAYVEFNLSDYIKKKNCVQYLSFDIINQSNADRFIEAGYNVHFRNNGCKILKGQQLLSVSILISNDSHYNKELNIRGSRKGGIFNFYDNTDTLKNIHFRIHDVRKGDRYTIIDKVRYYSQCEKIDSSKYPIADEFGQLSTDNFTYKVNSLRKLKSFDIFKDSNNVSMLDEYGGFKCGPKYENKTGSFCVKKIDGKWWFIDPNGYLFWSLGVTCVNIDEVSPISLNRRFLFDDRVLSHLEDSNSVNFVRYNIKMKYGDNYEKLYRATTLKRLHNWGINTIGAWSSPQIYKGAGVPYTIVINSWKISNTKFPDPFHSKFKSTLMETLSNTLNYESNDPYCIGFFVDNEIPWRDAVDILLRKCPSEQPAKLELVKFLEEKYNSDIKKLNKVWETNFISFKDIKYYREKNNNSIPDCNLFIIKLADLYFKECALSISSFTKSKLYLGARFDFQYYPLDSKYDEIVHLASLYTDVLSFNRYRYDVDDLVLRENIDKPILIGEFHFGTLQRGSLFPGLVYAHTLEDRGEAYHHYILSALENKQIVGAHWFQLFDQPITGRFDGENGQVGLISVTDRPYDELVKRIKFFKKNLYNTRKN